MTTRTELDWTQPHVIQEYCDIDMVPLRPLFPQRKYVRKLADMANVPLRDMTKIIYNDMAIKWGTARRIIWAAGEIYPDHPVVNGLDSKLPTEMRSAPPDYTPPTRDQMHLLLNTIRNILDLHPGELSTQLNEPVGSFRPGKEMEPLLAQHLRKYIVSKVDRVLDPFNCPHASAEKEYSEMVYMQRKYLYKVLNDILPEQKPYTSWLTPANMVIKKKSRF